MDLSRSEQAVKPMEVGMGSVSSSSHYPVGHDLQIPEHTWIIKGSFG